MKSKRIISSLLSLSIIGCTIFSGTSVQAATIQTNTLNSKQYRAISETYNCIASASGSGGVYTKMYTLSKLSHRLEIIVYFYDANDKQIDTKSTSAAYWTLSAGLGSTTKWTSAKVKFYSDGSLQSSQWVYNRFY